MLQIVIPARYQSVRLPGKPLIKINGKPMIEYVYNEAFSAYKMWDQDLKMLKPIISTDSDKIIDYCKKEDIPFVKTGACNTGTDRVNQSLDNINCDFVVNLQGDEPTLSSKFLYQFSIETVKRASDKKILSAYCDIPEVRANDKNNVKVIISYSGQIIYMTRLPQPSFSKSTNPGFYKQIGLYGFTKNSLSEFCSLPPSNLEAISNIELMRWIDHNKIVSGVYTSDISYSVDVIEDILVVERILDFKK